MDAGQQGALAGRLANAGLAKNIAVVPRVVPGDLAVDITQDQSLILTKGSAAAVSVAAPGAANVGRRLRFRSGSDFAHVVTFTGATLWDGTTGGHTTATFAAFTGSGLEVEAVNATNWALVAAVAQTIA